MRFHIEAFAMLAGALLVSSAGVAQAASSLDLGTATLTGAPKFTTTSARNGSYNGTIDLAAVTATSGDGTVGFSFNPAVHDYYYGGYAPSYNIYGAMSTLTGFTVTPDAGYQIDPGSVSYRVSGQVSVTDSATVTLSTGQTFRGANVRSQADVYDFTVDVSPIGGNLLTWSGSNPYYQGPNGTASVFSVADIKITQVEYSARVTAVPEPATWGMMALGLVGLGFARRRVIRAV
jgi:hypothetical protein